MLGISCAENLSLIPLSDGIAANTETPVTVYLKGVLDGAGSTEYSFLHYGENLSTVKTRSTIRKLRSIR